MKVIQPHEITEGALEAPPRNVFANTFFSFTRPKLSAQQRAFFDILKSGVLWEDGSNLALALVANKEKILIPAPQVVGGTIEANDPFWTEPRDDGASYLDMLVEHHLFQNDIVTFGSVNAANDPDHIGGGIFRVSLDPKTGSGDVRWASFACYQPNSHNSLDRDKEIQESIDRCRDQGWDVWVFETSLADRSVMQLDWRSTSIFVVFPDAVPVQKASYRIQKAMKSKVKRDYVKRCDIHHVQPSRTIGDKLCPIPSFSNAIYGLSVKVEHVT